MRITKFINTAIISSLFAAGVYSCKKAPYVKVQNVSLNIENKLHLLQHKTDKVLKDTSYHLYGYDTVKVNKDFYSSQREYLSDLTKQAIKKTPKTQVGKHIEVQMIPKQGGGFNQIHVWKKDYKPDYKDQRVVVNSEKVYTTDGKDIYIPVEYYGKINN